MSRVTAVCCAVVLALVPGVRADDKADDWKVLKGTWKVEKAVFKGNDSTEIFRSVVLTIDEGQYTVDFNGQEEKGTLKIDPAKNPKRMSIVCTEGTNKGKTVPSIYELTGDTLKICYDLDGKQPPAKFESTADTNTLLVTYKRDKK